jgi:predicted nuclease of predicted toxin-antitoxin system
MRFLIDENVNVRVAALFSSPQETLFSSPYETEVVQDVLQPGAPDPEVRRYARARGMILVTGDKGNAQRCGKDPRQPCLLLLGLYDKEVSRTSELLGVVLTEAALAGDRFWMEIKPAEYRVRR